MAKMNILGTCFSWCPITILVIVMVSKVWQNEKCNQVLLRGVSKAQVVEFM
jgi:hypothetical protein